MKGLRKVNADLVGFLGRSPQTEATWTWMTLVGARCPYQPLITYCVEPS